MKNNKLIFISDEQRTKLKKALNLVDDVFKNITIDYEDYTIIETTREYLIKSIKYEKEYY